MFTTNEDEYIIKQKTIKDVVWAIKNTKFTFRNTPKDLIISHILAQFIKEAV